MQSMKFLQSMVRAFFLAAVLAAPAQADHPMIHAGLKIVDDPDVEGRVIVTWENNPQGVLGYNQPGVSLQTIIKNGGIAFSHAGGRQFPKDSGVQATVPTSYSGFASGVVNKFTQAGLTIGVTYQFRLYFGGAFVNPGFDRMDFISEVVEHTPAPPPVSGQLKAIGFSLDLGVDDNDDPVEIAPAFDAGVFAYTAAVPAGTDSAEIVTEVSTMSEKLTVENNGNVVVLM